MKDNENCVLIASPDSAKQILDDDDKNAVRALVICMFAPPGTVLVAKQEDWNRMIDNGEVWGRKDDSTCFCSILRITE